MKAKNTSEFPGERERKIFYYTYAKYEKKIAGRDKFA